MYGAMAGPAPPRPFQDRTSAAVLTAALHSDDSGAGPPANKRAKPRSVIYKSSALVRAAPAIANAATQAEIASTLAIQRANQKAESVRDQFKQNKYGPEIDIGDGDDEATNARKYERRLKMNRSSAAASRVRREAYTKSLENELVAMERQYREALALIDQERQVIQSLMNRTERHESDMSSDDEPDDASGPEESQQDDPSTLDIATVQPSAASQPPASNSEMSLSVQLPEEISLVHPPDVPKVEDTMPLPLADLHDVPLDPTFELPEFFLDPDPSDLDKVDFDIPR